MRLFLLAGCLLLMIGASAQLTLTRGDVYNYSVGDQFLVHKYSIPFIYNPSLPPNPAWDERTTVLSKTLTVNGDTVNYTCLVETNYMYSHPVQISGGGYVMKRDTTFSQQTLVLSYTDLNSSIRNYPYPEGNPIDPCYVDSVDIITYSSQYCGRKTWHKHYIPGNNCFEPPFPSYDYVEGCGGPYYRIDDYAQGATLFSALTYFKKGGSSCGNNIAMDVRNYNADAHIVLYPNPVQTSLFVNSSDPIVALSLYSASGELVLQTNQPEQGTDVSKLARGIYCVLLSDAQGRCIVRKITKE